MQNALREEVRKLQRELDIRDDELAQRQADADHYVAEISALKSQVLTRSCATCVFSDRSVRYNFVPQSCVFLQGRMSRLV
jgi:hypothetical protein